MSLLLAAGAAPLVAAADATAPPPARVKIKDLAFDPKVLHVKTGTTVVWTNEDDVVHTVTSGKSTDDAVFESSPGIAGGQSFSHAFTKPGSYPYFCKPHFYNESMHGTVIVED